MPFLEMNNVGKSYAGADVLKDINLWIEEGEFVAIVGYSGAGKTTLINLLAGLVTPDAGEVLLGGEEITGPGPDRGVVFQNYSLLPWLTVRENVALAVDQVFPQWPRDQRRAHADRYIGMVNLAPAAGKRPMELSGGMRQRVSVARALAMDPKVLLLDEPLGALDALTRAVLQDEIQEIWRRDRKTVVLITNDVDEGILLADRIIPLSHGPAATLGPSFPVAIDRPRDRKALNHDERFKELRRRVMGWLQGDGSRRAAERRTRRALQPAVQSGPPRVKIGFIPLTDCAPFAVAKHRELFAKHGVEATLQKFPSWSALTDALSGGAIQAAHMPSSIPVAAAAGLLGRRVEPMVAPWVVNRNGQGITLLREVAAEVGDDPAKLKTYVDARRAAGEPVAFAHTHPFGTHALWLRHWLGAGGIDPDRDVTLVSVPPPQMVNSLRGGGLTGLCVGEPWNARAVSEGVGYTAVTSQQIWADHPEKVCAFTADFAEEHPGSVTAVLRGLHEASAWLDDPANRPAAAEILAGPLVINTPAESILPRLSGSYVMGDGRHLTDPTGGLEGMIFSVRNCNYPQPKFAAWHLSQFRRWGMLARQPDYGALAAKVMRPDLFEAAMAGVATDLSVADDSPATLFDGEAFDPSDPEGYARSFDVQSVAAERPAAPRRPVAAAV